MKQKTNYKSLYDEDDLTLLKEYDRLTYFSYTSIFHIGGMFIMIWILIKISIIFFVGMITILILYTLQRRKLLINIENELKGRELL